eukprot:10418032-Alexandrium_andersonii.AAC.1
MATACWTQRCRFDIATGLLIMAFRRPCYGPMGEGAISLQARERAGIVRPTCTAAGGLIFRIVR